LMDKVMTDAEIREAIAPYEFYHIIPRAPQSA
jgi:hypothetical protein